MLTVKESNAKKRNPDTNNFTWCNKNPLHEICDDCVVRAISTLLNQTWEKTLMELTETGIKLGRVLNDKETYHKYLIRKGFIKMKQPKKPNGKKYTIGEYADRTGFTCVAHAGNGHLTVIIEGICYDIWDCTGEKIGNYWIKPD